MKVHASQLTHVLVLALAGCNANTAVLSGMPVRGGIDQSVVGQSPEAKRKPLTPLDREAARWAIEAWKPTKLGESYYVWIIDNEKPFGTRDLTGRAETLVELREPVVTVDAQLDNADILNGLDWRGEVTLTAKGMRARRVRIPEGPADENWTEWTSSEMPVPTRAFGPTKGMTDEAAEQARSEVESATLYPVEEETMTIRLQKPRGKWRRAEDLTGFGRGRGITFREVRPSDLPK